ncbi:MAG: ribonuclease H-like domain-containing protein [Lachnospiraceae bacterium]|nr:ribonuclease H-like domain-containing protein [Lachnospiraceae bacterium]
MIKKIEPIKDFTLKYPLEKIAYIEDILFFDIETTGFTANSAYLYMIGCAYNASGEWYTIQWLAESYEEEQQVVEAFVSFARTYAVFIHFNGNNFDIPFIIKKLEKYNIDFDFTGYDGVDIYRRVSPYKYFLKLPNCKLKTIEEYLGCNREDELSGRDLINVYHEYVKDKDEEKGKLLLLHNHDDLKGMLEILPILGVYDMFNTLPAIHKVAINHYKDHHLAEKKELFMCLDLATPLPAPISANARSCFFKGEENYITLRVPVYEGELKYFYSNYKDYYYLPNEDVALHKSVSSFIDKDYRIPATAATCYTRKESRYLPQWSEQFVPFFKKEFKGHELFFEITDELKRDKDAFSKYALMVINMIASDY